MARLVRVSPTDIPQHIILRCNNRQICFVHDKDMKAYLHWLKLFSKKYQASVGCGGMRLTLVYYHFLQMKRLARRLD
jgi:hypothetical protein